MNKPDAKQTKPDSRLVKGVDGKIHTVYVRKNGRINYLLGVIEAFPAFSTQADARNVANLLQ